MHLRLLSWQGVLFIVGLGLLPACPTTVDDDDDDSSDCASPTAWYADSDQDGYGDAADTLDACEQPAGYVADDTDCDDSDGASYPTATELCDAADNDCDGTIDEDLAFADFTGTLSNLAAIESFCDDVCAGTVSGDVHLFDSGLTELNLGCLTEVGGEVAVQRNPSLTSVDLSGLVAVGGNLDFSENPSLDSVGDFSRLSSLGGSLSFLSNPLLTSLGDFSGLTDVRALYLDNNAGLTDLDALPNLASTELNCTIQRNSSLSSLGGLSALTSVGRDLNIGDNATLVGLGLSSLTSIAGDLWVEDNPLLCADEVADLEGGLSSYSGTTTNSGNTGTCP